MTVQHNPDKPAASTYVESRLRKAARKAMRNAGWHRAPVDSSIRGRLYQLTSRRLPWWDWGHRVMVLTGTSSGGNYDSPTFETWWYRKGGPPVAMRRTGYPCYPLRTFQVVKGDYDRFSEVYDPLSYDDRYEWKAIAVNQDNNLVLGRQYWGENFYGLDKWDVRLLRRYLRAWRRYDWYGVRSWLYAQALHAAVYQRRPFACNQPPPKNSGGYDHWLCQGRRRHDGPHRFNNYTWPREGITE